MSELITTNQIKQIAQNGAMVLETNKSRTEKAISVGNSILQSIQENGGLTSELDQRANKFLVNCRTAKKEMEEARKPLTQFFDQVKKEFTTLEGNLDISKSASIPFIIQSHRNDYVRKIREEEERKRQEVERKLSREKEEIDVKSTLELQFSSFVQDHIKNFKQGLQNKFNSITLEGFEKRAEELKNTTYFTETSLKNFVPQVSCIYLNKDELSSIISEFLNAQESRLNLLTATIEGEIAVYQNELIEKLPSLKNELVQLNKANEEERKRLEEERKQREDDERRKLEEQAQAEKKKQEEDIQLQKEAQKADAIVNTLELFEEKGPETRSGFEIKILHQAGAVEIFNFWFQKEGANSTIEEIEKKSIAQMKSFCERVAHKDGEMIASKYLKYEPVYKAVNRK